MGQTLTNGIYLPDEGEVRCYDGLASNWTTLDSVVGGYRAHAADLTIHVTAADKAAWNGKADASALTAHTGNTTIHVTAEDKSKWDAVTSKANDADAVHKSGAETIGGIKTFSDDTYFKSLNFTNEVASQSSSSSAILPLLATVTYRDETPSATAQFNLRITAAGEKSLYPHENNQYSLGLASRRLKEIHTYSLNVLSQINGINPGALSMPNLSAGVDISAYITNITGVSNINKFTPTADGWISIGLSNADFIEIYIPASLMGATFTKSTMNSTSLASMPVIANKEVKITLKGSSIGWAKFYPCQGNI